MWHSAPARRAHAVAVRAAHALTAVVPHRRAGVALWLNEPTSASLSDTLGG